MRMLLGGDWHFRHSNPKCRLDSYPETISRKLKWLTELKDELNVPIISGGDITDLCLYTAPKDIVASINLLEEMPPMAGICGNHDFVHRSAEYLDKSIISIFIKSGKMTHIQGHYDLDPNTRIFGFDYGTGGIVHPAPEDLIDGTNIAIMHEYTSKKENSIFGKYVGKELLEEFSEFDIIFTSDNHVTFTEELDGRFLINPGSFLRMTADQIEHKPCVYLVDTESMSFEQIFVPIEEGIISRKHIEIQKDREDNMTSFVINMDNEYEVSETYEKNLELYITENRFDENEIILINKNVEKFINKALEGDSEYE